MVLEVSGLILLISTKTRLLPRSRCLPCNLDIIVWVVKHESQQMRALYGMGFVRVPQEIGQKVEQFEPLGLRSSLVISTFSTMPLLCGFLLVQHTKRKVRFQSFCWFPHGFLSLSCWFVKDVLALCLSRNLCSARLVIESVMNTRTK